VPPRSDLYTDRTRANSFGAAAQRYDDYRPHYPDALIDDLLAPDCGAVRKCLDVGAGTGIASKQLADRGVDVLAVEPDERMATVLRGKLIPAEIATFEQWDPRGRRFDLVVFAASYHWVDPAVALPKITGILTDGGRLALLWNRLRPIAPTQAQFSEIYRDYLPPHACDRDPDPDGVRSVVDTLRAAGFNVSQRSYARTLQFSRDQWVEVLFTFSKYLTLPQDAADSLRRRLAERIDDSGVTVGGDALAIVATPIRPRGPR
jgi:SAM-dependent methyltransferase